LNNVEDYVATYKAIMKGCNPVTILVSIKVKEDINCKNVLSKTKSLMKPIILMYDPSGKPKKLFEPSDLFMNSK